ncbi:MAG: lytic transglycosylase domain-containing protein [Sphingomonadaceae bacterium]|nr:lytic transglycosylase domain-containing protein [Sphingomonadaceae bacterium]
MARLIVPALALALLWTTPLQANSIARWQPFITEASLRFGIPEEWIVRVMHAESRGHTSRGGKPIRSRVGAMGLMQIMPGTWAALTARYGLGSNPDDPRANILGGTAYLREMYDLFGYPGLFAAYNAGPGRYASYRAGKSRLLGETIAYVASITGSTPSRSNAPVKADMDGEKLAAASLPPKLFFVTRAAPKSPTADQQEANGTGLFAIKNPSAAGAQ